MDAETIYLALCAFWGMMLSLMLAMPYRTQAPVEQIMMATMSNSTAVDPAYTEYITHAIRSANRKGSNIGIFAGVCVLIFMWIRRR